MSAADPARGPTVRGAPAPSQAELQTRTWRDRFNHWADRATQALGSAWALLLSVVLVAVWAAAGPIFNFSDTWQLFINTVTTVITYWMVFVIQNSQNRDARAIHLKLDEIIRANQDARNQFIVAEKATEAELDAHESELHELVDTADPEAAPALDRDRVQGAVGQTPSGSSGNGA